MREEAVRLRVLSLIKIIFSRIVRSFCENEFTYY